MPGHARRGHNGKGGRGARDDSVAEPAPLSLAEAVVAIMRDPKVKLPPPFDVLRSRRPHPHCASKTRVNPLMPLKGREKKNPWRAIRCR